MNFFICSYGGSGSKMVRSFLATYGNTYHPHSSSPPSILSIPCEKKGLTECTFVENGKLVNVTRAKVIYLFRDPVDVLISRYGKQHCANIGGEYTELPETLEEYARVGIERFNLESHFKCWTQADRSKRNYDICCMKYEEIWQYLPQLFDFLDLPSSDIRLFPKRKETKKIIPQETDYNLRRMYSSLIHQMEESPPFKVY